MRLESLHRIPVIKDIMPKLPMDEDYVIIDESVKFLDRNASNIRIIRGESDLIQYFNNNLDNRIVYDIANKWYLVGDIEKYIHDYLLDYACDAGLYNVKSGREYKINNESSLVCFVTHGDENESFRFAEDGYTTQYNYSWINVFDRNGEFKKTPLFKAMGKPIYEINISEEDDEYLDESLIKESISFEPTDEYFSIGGKEFHEEGSDVYNIYNDGVHIGMLALEEFPDGINLEGLEIFKQYRKQGYGKKVVDLLKKKYEGIYVRSIPSAKKFWQKQGHKAYYNKDSGTYDGDLIYEEIAHAEMNDDDMVVILHNPTRKELRDHHLDDECRIVYDGNNGYYFASSEWTHEQIEQKLQANNLPYSETSGEFYYYQDNLFTTRDDWSSEEEYQEYKNDWYQSLKSMPYIVKNFGNFKVEIFKGEYLCEEYEGLNRIAGFYWFDRHNWLEDGHFQLLKRKPEGVEKLDPEDNELDYYHLDNDGLEEDNKARFGIEKIGKKLVCYIEAEDKQKCLIAKKAIQRKFNDILIDKFQLSWGRNNFTELDESIAYAERSDDYYDDSEYQDMTNVILKNPSRKELIDNGMIECRIVKDYKDNFYFANSYEMIHTDIVDKLESENITSVETNLFYDVNSNTFYYNVGHLADNEIKDFSQREEQMLRTSSYVSKTFKNFKFKLTYGEM